MRFEITEPCDEPWDRMTPRGNGRHCVRCDKVVIDMTKMTRREAKAALAEVEGDTACVQLDFDRFADPVFPPEPKRAPHWASGLVLVAALTAGGCSTRRGERAEIVEEEEPEVAEGPPMMPPMMPLDGAVEDDEPEFVTGPVPASELASSSDAATPTAEQRQLTAQKEARNHPMRTLGRMPIRRARGGMAIHWPNP